jgi:ABC-type Zn uptake system ZnuABC Zn-binding protein ZnuA
MRLSAPLIYPVIGVLCSLLMAMPLGCGPDATPTPEPLHVMTTVYAMADIVRQVGGERVSVQWWVESGQSLAQLQETPERRQQFRNADLVVTRGAADPWTLEGSGNAYRDRRLLRVDALSAARGWETRHYLWLDPQVALELCDELVTRLSTLEPRSESYFKGNAAKFHERIAGLIDQTSTVINRAGGGSFPTLDPGFLPMARRFGLLEVRAPSISLAEPSAYNAKVLRETIKTAGAGAIFASSESSTALLRDWESRVGVPVLPLDALGTSAPTGRSEYVSMLQYNLSQLERGIALAPPRAPIPLGAPVQRDDTDLRPPTTVPSLAPLAEPPPPVDGRLRLRVPTTAPTLPPGPFDVPPLKNAPKK